MLMIIVGTHRSNDRKSIQHFVPYWMGEK